MRWRILNRMLRVTARLACLFAIPRVGPRGLKSLFAVLTLVSVSPRVMGGDPVAWWVADDFSTGSANWVDRIGKKVAVSYGQLNNAQGVAFDNGPVKATGQFRGGAASAGIVLDGVNDYFEVTADNNPVAGQKTVTIVALFKASQPSTGIDGNHWRYPGPINAEAPGAPNDFGLTVGADGKAHGFFNDAIPTTSPVVVVDGLPHTLVLTWSAKDLGNGLTGDGIARFYVDGVLQGSLATDAGSGIVNYGMRFGRDRETTDRWFRGTLGELRFYASIEDPTEIHKTIAGQKQLLVNSEFTSVGQDGVNPSGWSSSAGFVAPCGAYCGGSDTTPAWDGNNLRFGFSPSAIVIQEVSVDGVSGLSRFLLEYEVGNVIVSGLYSVKAEFLDAGRQVLGSIRKPISSWETAPSPATTQSLVLSRSSTTWFSQIASVRISVQGTQGSDSSPSHIWSGHYGPAFGFVRLWAESGKPTAPLLAGKNAPIQVVVDNDYALLAGSPSGPTRVVYQPGTGGLEAQVALGLGGSVRMNLLEGESYLYLVAMGGGGREAVEGSINGVNLVSLAVPRGQAAVDPQGAYLNLSPSWTGFSGASVAAGDFSVSLAQVHSALQGAIWGSPASKSIPPLKPELGSSAWPFPSDISVAFRFQATALALVPIPGDRSVSLSWSPPSVDGGTPITDYRIQYSIDGIDWMTFSDGVSATTSSVVTGLINGTAYRFRVAAINDSGVGYDSVESASVRPLGPFAPISLAGAEDQVVSFTPSTFILAFSNGSGPSLYGIRIESLPSTGTLKLFGNLVLAGDFIITADLGQLAYEPAANETGAKTFEVQASDGLSLTAKSVVSVVLAPANDAPSLAAISVSGTEDTTVAFAASNFTSAYSDVEQTALASITVVSLPTSGTLKLSGNAVAAGQVISAQNLANLTYVPAANENGAKTFTVSASDGALSSPTATVTINLAAVNDAPVLGSIGGAAGWSFFTDFSTLHPKATLAGVTKLQNGELVLTEAVNSQYGYMTLEPFSANPSAFVAEFQYRVYDGTGADGVSFNYGQLTRSPGIPEYGTFFPEYGIISPEAGGTTDTGLAVSFIEWEGQRVLVRAYNTTLATIPFDLMSPDYRKVRISVDDAGLVSVSIGGQPVVSQLDLGDTYRLANKTSWQFGFGARTGAANNRHSLDDLHIGPGGLVPDTFTFAEDAPGSIVFPGSPFSDVDSTSLTVTLEVPAGTLSGAEVAGVVVGGSAQARTFAGTVAALNAYFAGSGNITYQGAPNASGNVTLAIRLSDGQSTPSTTSVLSITPVNDAPSLAAISVNGTEDTIVALDAALLTSALFTSAYSDVEQTALASITVVSLPTSGTLELSGNLVVAGQVITAQELANLAYVPAANENGAKTFTVSASDGALSSPTATVTINLAPVNDAPTIAAIAAQTTLEDTATAPIVFSVADSETPAARLTVTASSSNPDVVAASGISLGFGAPSQGLIGRWSFDSADDLGRDLMTGESLVKSGAPAWTSSGKLGGALELNGSSWLSASSGTINKLPLGNSTYSVSLWFKARTFGAKGFVGWGDYWQNNNVNAFRLDGDTRIVNYWWANDLSAPVGSTLSPNVWYHAVATYDGTRRSIYLNGQKIGSLVDSRADVQPLNFGIGKTYGSEYFDGWLDEVAIYDRALSDTEVAQLAQVASNDRTITVTPVPNASGTSTITVTATDEANATATTAFTVTVGAVNDAPLFTSVNPLTGGIEDTDFTISCEALAAAADESDVDSTNLQFRIESVSSGTLTLGGVPVTTGSTLLAAGQSLVWRPAPDANGLIEALKVKAWDGQLHSAVAVPVMVSVAAVADPVTIEGLVGVSRAYDGTRIASATGTPVLKGVADGADVNLTGTPVFTFAQAGVSDSAVSIAVSGYTLTGAQAQDYVLTQPTLSASITSRAVAVGGLSGVDKVYDGTTVATASGTATLAGVLQGDTVTMTGTPVFTFAGSKVGAGITIATTGYGLSGGQAGNYSLTQPTLSANITPKPLTVIGLTANNKIYDGTTAATVSGTASLSGIVSGDESKVTLTGTPAYAFKNANLGNGTPVTTTGFSLSGDLAGNYGLTQPTLSANITTDGLVGGQLIAFSQSLIQIAANGQFTIKQSSQLPAGALVERVVFSFEYSTYWNWNAVAGNYAQLNGVDLPGAGWTSLGTGSGWKAQTTVYQGTLPSFNRSGDNLWLLGSAWNPVSIRNAKMTIYYWLPGKLSQTLTFGPLANVAYGADDVPLLASASSGLPVAWEVASGPGRISGSSLVVQAAGSIVIRASQAGDAVWFAAEPVERTLVVGKKAISLVGVTAMDKVYDGTASARLAFSGAALSGIVSGDAGAVALDSVSASASFGSPAAGDNKPVTVNRLDLSGTAAGNYSLILPTLSANITPKPLKVTGLIADNKTYDRTTAATVSGTASLVGVITGDAVSLAGTPVLQFASANVGTGIAITASGYALSGNQAGNYTLTQPTGLTANITGKALTISGAMVANKVYDGTTVATVSFAGANLSGVLANDEVSLSAKDAIGTFADAGVGLRKPVTVTGLSLSGNAAGNYTLGTPSGLKADITAKTLSLVGLGGSDKIYDGTVAATVSGTGSLSGLILGDGVSLSGTPVFSFSSANVGTGIPITITGYALSGIHAANYTLTMPILSASITPKALTLKVLAASRAYRASNPSFEFEAFASQLVAGDTTAQVIGGNGAASDLVYRLAGTTVASAVGVYRSEIRVDPASIDGSKASNYAVTVVSGDLTITPAALTITLDAGSLAQSFTGTPRSVSWFTQPSGVATKATYNGSPNPPVVAGTYAVVVQSEDANYAGQVSGVLLIRSTLEALKSESFLIAAGLMSVTGGEGRYRLEASLGQTFAGAVPVVTGIQVEAGFWFTGRLSEALSPAGVQVPSAEVAAKGIAVLATTSSTGSSVDPSQAASVRDPQMASGIRLPEARLTVSPSPESLRVRIQVSGISGAQWKVQYLDGLRSGGWQDAGLLRLDSEGMGVIETDAVEDSAMRFYRLVQP